jgi:NAD+-dependent protein deacetylase sirtuin 4
MAVAARGEGELLPGIERLAGLMRGRKVLALSGAGLSTESGIPDYRGPRSIARQGRPIYYREFVESPDTRARYWARSAVGWPRVSEARPNAGHFALAALENDGILTGVITQNVDGLHHAAGSRIVLELHGSLTDVLCLACGAREPRAGFQERILFLNPSWAAGSFRAAAAEPDGDARVEPPADGSFRVPDCQRCGGILKPDVVFFGENVPRERVQAAMEMLGGADVLLVVGSSLAVFSGYRFVTRAVEDRKPVAIINSGPTRGDPVAAVRIEAALGEALPQLAAALEAPPRGAEAMRTRAPRE